MLRTAWNRSQRRRTSPERARLGPRLRPAIEQLEDRTLLNGSFGSPTPITLSPIGTATVPGTLGLFGSFADVYSVTLPADGLLVLTATNAPSTRLSLFSQGPTPLAQSDGVAGAPGTDVVEQHLSGGATYLIEMQELDQTASCSYTLQVQYTPAMAPFQPIQIAAGPVSMVMADFNGDGIPDLATSSFTNDTTPGTSTLSILLGVGDGTFQPPAAPAPSFVPFFLPPYPLTLTAADLGNGHMDLIAIDQTNGGAFVMLGLGDGTFQQPNVFATGGPVSGSPLVANFNGIPDLAVANANNGTVTILLGDGTGYFPSSVTLNVGTAPGYLAAGNFGNGHLDLAVADTGSADISVLLGDGHGNFQSAVNPPLTGNPAGLVAADFNNDGVQDLAATLPSSGEVAVLLGSGGGAFAPAVNYSAYPFNFGFATPAPIQAGDLGNGHVDLIVTAQSNVVSVLLGNGDGTFQAPSFYNLALRDTPAALMLADLGNGHLDVLTLNIPPSQSFPAQSAPPSTISVLIGNGDGTLQGPVDYSAGIGAIGLAPVDFGSGYTDLVVVAQNQVGPPSSAIPGSVSVLLGNGNGAFQTASSSPVGQGPTSAIAVDVNGDGKPDLVVADTGAAAVSVLVSNGDGTFQPANTYTLPLQTNPFVPLPSPGPIVAGDFNGDGRVDLAVASLNVAMIALLYGNGDGTFVAGPTIRVPLGKVIGMVAADLNGDHLTDIVATTGFPNAASTSAAIVITNLGHGQFGAGPIIPPDLVNNSIIETAPLLTDFNHDGKPDLVVGLRRGTSLLVAVSQGNGGFSFRPPVYYTVESFPSGVTQEFADLQAADLNGDSNLDLVASLAGFNGASGDLAVLIGNGNLTFQTPAGLYAGAAGPMLFSGIAPMVVGDFGNGHIDVATVYSNGSTNLVTVWLGDGTGGFAPAVQYNVGPGAQAIAFARFPDGGTALITADQQAGISVLYGAGAGLFKPAVSMPTGIFPFAVVTADFGNGEPDLAVIDNGSNDVSFYLGAAQFPPGVAPDTFVASGSLANPIQDTPFTADPAFSGSGGIVLVDQTGDVLFRQADPSHPGVFEAPVVVNLNGPAARAVAVVSQLGGDLIAALAANGDLITLYQRNADGSFSPLPTTLPTGPSPTRILAADLTRSGKDDSLIVLNSGDGTVTIFLPNGSGGYVSPPAVPVGLGASDLAVVFGPNGSPEILVSNRSTGGVSILNGFTLEGDTRGGPGPFGLNAASSPVAVVSQIATGGLVTGNFTGSGQTDAITFNAGSDSLSLLPGTAFNGFLNPINLVLGYAPGPIVTGDFTGSTFSDLAVLDPAHGLVHVYLNNGAGSFTEKFSLNLDGTLGPLAVGSAATDLTVADVNGDGKMDLVVGNRTGDILVLVGKGDGTFQPLSAASFGVNVSLVTTASGVITADEATGNVTTYTLSPSGSSFIPATTLATASGVTITQRPTNAVSADLNGDGFQDLIVPNTGSNTMSVFLALDNTGLHFQAPLTFAVGTDPVGVAVTQLLVNTSLDVAVAVANKGSNDVSLFYGQGSGATWTLVPGPRVHIDTNSTGPTAAGPIAVSFQGNPNIPNLVTVNSNGTTSVVPGVGNGYFNDQQGSTTTQSLPNTSGAKQADFNDGLILTNDGSVIQFNPATLSGSGTVGKVVYTTPIGTTPPTFVQAFTGSTGTDLFLGNSNGSIQLLTADAAGDFAAVGTAFTAPDLTDVSTLQVVQSEGNNQFELYATNAGEDLPVVVQFRLDEAANPTELPAADLSGGIPLLIGPTTTVLTISVPTADLTSLTEGSVATIATLSTVTSSEQLTLSELGVTAPGEVGLALASSLNGSEVVLLEGVLVASAGSDVGNAAPQSGDGEVVSDVGGGLVDPHELNPRLMTERLITGVEARLELAIQEGQGSRGSGVSAEELRRALDQLFARIGASSTVQDGAEVFGQSSATVQQSLSAPGGNWLKPATAGQDAGVRWIDIFATVETSVQGVDRVFMNVTDQLLAPTPQGPGQRVAPVDTPLSRPLNPLEGDSRAPADDRPTAVWVAVALAAGLGGDVGRRVSRSGNNDRDGRRIAGKRRDPMDQE